MRADVGLISVDSLPELVRAQRWTPTPEILEAIEPGRAEIKLLALELEDDGGASVDDAHHVWVRVTERDRTHFAGTVVRSTLDREGFRVGEHLRAAFGCVFDLAVSGETGAARLNEERARFALGKRILVGLTTLDSTGAEVERREYVGRLVSVDAARGLQLEVADGSHEWLPPDVRPLEEAARGEYRLRTTGEVVEDPDCICTWTTTRPPPASPST